jgi:hypothetical protein
LKVESSKERLGTYTETEGAEGTEKKGKSTGLKTGHYKEEPYD